MQLCFFEDHRHKRFQPLTLTRPLEDLRSGILTIGKKWETELNSAGIVRTFRPGLQEVFPRGSIDPTQPSLWINSRCFPEQRLLEEIRNLNPGSCLRNGKTVLAAQVDGSAAGEWLANGEADFNSLLVVETDFEVSLDYLWDLFLQNGTEIDSDLRRLGITGIADSSAVSKNALLENRGEIYIDEGARVEAGAILIADDGPVYIGKNATVKAGAILRGPVAVCEEAVVNMGARIYDGTTIGPVCKAGGEICNSIFHSFSNKAHDGFVGHSLIGQWCNLGADTNTSNLKNNYSTVQITDWASGESVETGQLFAGTIMGDHSKTAINVQLNTGTVCGVSCNIFTSDFPPGMIPSFSWVGTNVIQPYKFEKAIETMRAVMKRRGVELQAPYLKMMQEISEEGRS